MAINAISTTVRNAMCDAFVDALDTGSAQSGASMNGYTSGYATLLFTNRMSAPAYGASASGTATANAIADETNAPASGTAAVGRHLDRDDTQHSDYTIGTSGEDLNLNTTSITSGDTVSITSATITQPAA